MGTLICRPCCISRGNASEAPLEATVLFLVATTIFDVIHFTLHRLNERAGCAWLEALASLHQAHHDFCDRGLIYHDNGSCSIWLHVIPEYSTQMAAAPCLCCY